MPVFYSPQGNPEIWADCPEGYVTPDEWAASHPVPAPTPPTLEKVRQARCVEILSGYDAALAASLTMPAAAPTTQDVAVGAALFAVEDAEGLAYVQTLHAARRDELLAAVEAAETVEAVQSIEVSYAV